MIYQPKPKYRTAIGRSLDIYFRDEVRARRMDALNAQFVHSGGLAFDIGAHVGDRTGSFLRLGARVVAVEPQPRVFRALRLIHGKSEDVTLVQSAVGAAPGCLTLHLNTANPTISTASAELIEAAQSAQEWQGQVWESAITVPVTTLDALIAENGLPDFMKIDVEGYELEVLRGLSHQVPALSFEFTTIQRELAYRCLTQLSSLGSYSYRFSLGETHKMEQSDWVDRETITAELAALPMSANSGDIFAQWKC